MFKYREYLVSINGLDYLVCGEFLWTGEHQPVTILNEASLEQVNDLDASEYDHTMAAACQMAREDESLRSN